MKLNGTKKLVNIEICDYTCRTQRLSVLFFQHRLRHLRFLVWFSASCDFKQFFSLVLGGSQPAVYPEGFAPEHHGEAKDEVLRHVHSGPGRDRKPAEGGQTVPAAS